ncbi:MAG: 4-(cytidine 5'-diphospho)-2-C-methyl-D-erythritol kinase [Alphaproteobacteria bacterium]
MTAALSSAPPSSAPPSSAPLSVAAPAKINLYLHVTGRRADGYHLLDSLVAFAGVHDMLTVSDADNLELTIDGDFAGDLTTGDDNLVIRAAHALGRAAGIKAEAAISLTKRLPLASGIGGGSADAAATLWALSNLWDIDLGDDELAAVALSLGADVPVCLGGKAAFMSGIGEILSPAPALPAASVVLVNPGVAVSTPAVFRALDGNFTPADGRFDYVPADARELASILAKRNNDLEAPALHLEPVIGEVLAALAATDDILLARMSGSGATCFGLFADPGEAARAALCIATARPDWWIKAASLEADTRRFTGAST